ncbi:hypothetical protein KR044_009259 [Drosophila immigrans]|nr:hypothetical protein KR044_009259 [Drosophila immigrans]
MTYRFDSDLRLSEYYFAALNSIPRPVEKFDQPDRIMMHFSSSISFAWQKKRKLAACVSYSDSDSTRLESVYFKEMRKHMDLGFVMNNTMDDWGAYKFLLIFEPTACPDFVHPQIYMAMKNFMVPVVISPGNISHLLPPGSYISGDVDFLAPERLSQFLIKVGDQPHLYAQYFWWHSKYYIHQIEDPYCAICDVLRKPKRQRQSMQFFKWWTKYKCRDVHH